MKKILLTLAILAMSLLAMVGCGDKTGDRDGVVKVKYDSETGKVSLTATLTRDTLKKYKNETLYLMEIPAGQSVADVSTSVPAAQLKAKGTMEYSLALKSGARTLLYSGFVLAYYDYAEGYTPMGEVRYVENPEALASSKTAYPSYASPKGLFVTSAAEAEKTGTNHTVIRVPIDKFIRAKGDSETVAAIFCGNTYYINRAELQRLDHKVKTMSDAGIEVLLQFTLDTDPYELDSGIGKLASVYNADGSKTEGEHEHYALCIPDPDGFEKLASFFEYIAERYTREDGEYGFAGAFIIGSCVNDLESSNADRERTLAETTESYARLLRIAYTALRSKYSNGKVFVSVDSNWLPRSEGGNAEIPADTEGEQSAETSAVSETGEQTTAPSTPDKAPAEEMPVARRRRFGSKEFLSNLAARLIKGGDIQYSVCMTLLHDGDSDVSNDIGGKGKDAEKINCENLSTLDSFLQGTGLTWKDERRELALIASLPAENEKKMAESYARLYFESLERGVSAFIYNGERDGETGNGETGLMTSAAEGHKPEKRKIYDIYSAIDSTDSVEVLKKLSSSLGKTAEKYSEENSSVKVLTLSGSVTEKKEKRTEKTALFTFDGVSAAGFYPAYSASLIEPRGEGSEACIYSALSPLGPGDLMGVCSPELTGESFKRARSLKLVLNAALPSSNTSKVTLFLSGSGEGGDVRLLSEATVQSGNRQTVYFDISSFAEAIEDEDSVRLSVWCEADNNAPIRGGDADIGGYSLSIYGIELSSKKPISPLIWIIPLIIVIIGGIFLFIRFGLPLAAEAISNYRENTAREKAQKERARFERGRRDMPRHRSGPPSGQARERGRAPRQSEPQRGRDVPRQARPYPPSPPGRRGENDRARRG